MSSPNSALYFNLIRVQQAVVDSELHELGQQVQNLSLQSHGGAGSVQFQSFDHQRFKETNMVMDGILEKERQHWTERAMENTPWQTLRQKSRSSKKREPQAYLVPSVTCCISNVGPQLVWSFLHYIKPSRSRKWGMFYLFKHIASAPVLHLGLATAHPELSCSCSACTILRRLASARAWVKCVYGAMKQ